MKINLDDLPPHIKALNPDLYGRGAVGGLPAKKPQPAARPALVQPRQGCQGGKASLAEGGPRVRVCLAVHRRRLITDRDNLIGGCKSLRDAIARSLGLDDSDEVIEWEYHQIKTQGAQGVAVKIERMP